MSDYKLVPFEPTPEMVSAAEDAYMPFGDMDLALRMAILAAPAVQGEPVGWVNSDELDNMLDDRTATLFPVRTGFHGKPLYAAPQPAVQQPAPDVARLVGKVRMLIATGNRLSAEAQECTFDDGAAEVASVDFWCEFRDALEAATEALAAHHIKENGNE